MYQACHQRTLHSVCIGFLLCIYNMGYTAVGRLGKTHFIEGLSARLHRTWTHKRLPGEQSMPRPADSVVFAQDPRISCLFSDRDNLREQFVRCIQQETDAIDIAAFALTDKHIAEALQEADARGVPIRLLVDKNLVRDHAQKLDWVKNGAHAKLTIYNPPSRGWYTPSMHNKYALFYNQNGEPLVWTGSYNLSRKASDHNEENVIKVRDNIVFDDYKHNFEALLSKCAEFGSAKTPEQ